MLMDVENGLIWLEILQMTNNENIDQLRALLYKQVSKIRKKRYPFIKN